MMGGDVDEVGILLMSRECLELLRLLGLSLVEWMRHVVCTQQYVRVIMWGGKWL